MINVNKKTVITLSIVVIIAIVAVIAVIKNVDKTKYIAQVNSEGISRIDYQNKLDQRENFFKSQKQNLSNLSSLPDDVLDTMIDESLVSQYAAKNKITVTDSEIEIRYQQVVAGFNRNNKITGSEDIAFLSKIKEMYGTEKSDYFLTLEMDILKEKVQTSVGMPLSKWLEQERAKGNIER